MNRQVVLRSIILHLNEKKYKDTLSLKDLMLCHFSEISFDTSKVKISITGQRSYVYQLISELSRY